jgi:serine protease AprX
MELKREWIEALVFGDEESRRYTQDSPILPDVWIRYGLGAARGKDEAVDLLLTPHLRGTAGDLFREVRRRLAEERATGGRSARLRAAGGIVARVPARGVEERRAPHPDVAYNQSTVVARMYLDELLRVALPLTTWWRQRVCEEGAGEEVPALTSRAGRERLERLLDQIATDVGGSGRTDLAWLVRLVGSIQLAAEADDTFREEWRREHDGAPYQAPTEETRKARWEQITKDHAGQIERFRALVVEPMGVPECESGTCPPLLLFMVSQNRDATPTIAQSVKAVKGDAARRLFEASCDSLAWAILDSGIDATHGAFRVVSGGRGVKEAFGFNERGPVNNTRVRATFDFTRIRPLLSADPEAARAEARKLDEPIAKLDLALADPSLADALERKRLEWVRARMETQRKRWRTLADDLEEDPDEGARSLKAALQSGRAINWDELRPFIEIPHEKELYVEPEHEHGTHVAGILAADWREELWTPAEGEDEPPEYPEFELVGVCPDIRVYDFRVFGPRGKGNEFSIMAALQFLRHLNAQREVQLIHGANLSLSIRHDVANFACGRTPVCDECERVVNSGVVVVAAAGNQGYNRFDTRTEAGVASTYEGYSAISITDPGNAEGVITVGATHRIEPHTYGVSYFSSRGPTGDGRYKPDLVAPGEKIRAPVPGNKSTIKDGTSMAAPHVSGAAALILARYREFIGRPMRVRQVLCSTATDLGRDRYFQGSGMVDVLRALQSV